MTDIDPTKIVIAPSLPGYIARAKVGNTLYFTLSPSRVDLADIGGSAGNGGADDKGKGSKKSEKDKNDNYIKELEADIADKNAEIGSLLRDNKQDRNQITRAHVAYVTQNTHTDAELVELLARINRAEAGTKHIQDVTESDVDSVRDDKIAYMIKEFAKRDPKTARDIGASILLEHVPEEVEKMLEDARVRMQMAYDRVVDSQTKLGILNQYLSAVEKAEKDGDDGFKKFYETRAVHAGVISISNSTQGLSRDADKTDVVVFLRTKTGLSTDITRAEKAFNEAVKLYDARLKAVQDVKKIRTSMDKTIEKRLADHFAVHGAMDEYTVEKRVESNARLLNIIQESTNRISKRKERLHRLDREVKAKKQYLESARGT